MDTLSSRIDQLAATNDLAAAEQLCAGWSAANGGHLHALALCDKLNTQDFGDFEKQETLIGNLALQVLSATEEVPLETAILLATHLAGAARGTNDDALLEALLATWKRLETAGNGNRS